VKPKSFMTATGDEIVAQRCPHCGAALAKARRRAVVGRPLSECISCGGVVLRQGASEWALLGAAQRLDLVAHHALWALAVGVVALPVYFVAAKALERPWRPLNAAICLAAGIALAGGWMGSRLALTIRRSQRRMRDPMYLAKLVQHELADPRR
jgi:hypothetical protein